MERKIICNNWEVNLSYTLLSKVLNNSYFSDHFFGTITYPFDIYADEKNSQFIYHYNKYNFQKIYKNLILQEDGKLDECKLMILESEGKKLSAQLVIGFDDFPNFDKKLSELSLHQFNLSSSIYEHAESIVGKTYPEVDYNFPVIHTDLIDKESYLFQFFRGSYNLYSGQNFIRNMVDGENIVKNYNVMWPAIYLLYILKTGYKDAGYELKGDILEDDLIKKLLLFKGDTFSSLNYPENVDWIITRTSSEVSPGNVSSAFKEEQPLPFNGRFRVKGTAYLKAYGFYLLRNKNNPSEIYWQGKKTDSNANNTEVTNVDFILNTTKDFVLEFYLSNGRYSDENIMNLQIFPLNIYDETGVEIIPTLDPSMINLKKCVPDITFGELIRALKNTFNIDLDRDNKIIYMNRIEKNVKDISNVVDFSSFETPVPSIKFNDTLSFLFKFQFDNDEFKWPVLYVDESGIKNENFLQEENTNEIISSIIPLPLITRNGFYSAKMISDSEDIQIVIYEGLQANGNESLSNEPLLWNSLYENYWKEWIEFRLNSSNFIWKINISKSVMKNITAKSKIFAYNRIHIIKKITRNDLSSTAEEVELDTYSE